MYIAYYTNGKVCIKVGTPDDPRLNTGAWVQITESQYNEWRIPKIETDRADLLDALKLAADALSDAQGEWASVSETYAPEEMQPLKAAEAEARAAIAKAS